MRTHAPEDTSALPSSRWSLRRWFVSITVTALSVVGLWVLLEHLIASDRGLDLADEGLYLVAADPPNLEAAWAYPFGWTIRPLFWLVGYDIAAFRTFGAVILALSSAWLGWAAMRAVTDLRRATTAPSLMPALAAATAGTASLIYYSSMLRAPSYNWATLCAIVLSLAAVMVAVRRAVAPAPRDWRWNIGRIEISTIDLLAVATSAVLVASLPAKPTTLPIMLTVTTIVIATGAGLRCMWRWLIVVVGFIPAWILIAVITGLWPVDFIRVFRLANEMPYPFAVQTAGPALQAIVLAPRDLLDAFAQIGDRPAELLTAALLVLLLPVLAKRSWLLLRLAGYAMAILSAIAISGVPIPLLNLTGSAFSWAHAPLTTAAIIVLAASILVGLRLTSTAQNEEASDRRTRMLIVAVVALAPMAFAIGSSFGPYPQAAVASGLIFIAAVLSVARPNACRARTLLAVAVLVTTAIFAAAAIVSGWRHPLRQFPVELRTPSMSQQTVPTLIGAHGAVLNLDPALAARVTDLRAKSTAAGWKSGMPMLDLSYLQSPGLGYSLGAKAPDSLMLTVLIVGFGDNYRAITRFHLTQPFLGFPYHDSWILTTKTSTLDAATQDELFYTLGQVAAISQRPFPAGYDCVASGDLVLWRPSATSTGIGQNCDAGVRATAS
ncbi:MAG: hypothetical protein PHN51_06895 [Candidatus Nanopelagicales bacterium]|nr:hypothetical protein [Candidatus Nanopelagicales bacterium]